jgi:hypothetical protein
METMGLSNSGEEEQQMPGAWLVWSDPENERPGAESEESEADETSAWPLTQPVKGWTAAESLLPGSKDLPSMTRELSGQGSKEQRRRLQLKKEREYLNRTFGDISRFFCG